MCGLIGFSGVNNFNVDKIKLLLYYNATERFSKDSTGLYSLNNGLIKSVDEAKEFLAKKEIKEDKLLIAHVRNKTSGFTKEENAHPFEFDNVVGVHNGTLTNCYDLCTSMGKAWNDFDVDSMVLFYGLNFYNNTKILTEAEGKIAVLFIDKRQPDLLYVFRNNCDRNLYRGKLNGDMYISSEENALKIIGCTSVKEFKEERLYTVKDGEIKEHIKLKCKPCKPVATTYFYRNYRTYDDTNDNTNGVTNKECTGRWLRCKQSSSDRFAEYDKWYKCVGYVASNTSQIIILNELNQQKTLPTYLFDIDYSIIRTGDFVVAQQELHADGGKGVLTVNKDEVLFTIQDNGNGWFNCENALGVTHNIHHKNLRRANSIEIQSYSRQPLDDNYYILKNKNLSELITVMEGTLNDMKTSQLPVDLEICCRKLDEVLSVMDEKINQEENEVVND